MTKWPNSSTRGAGMRMCWLRRKLTQREHERGSGFVIECKDNISSMKILRKSMIFCKLITQIKYVYFSLCCGKGTFFMSCRVSRKLVVFLSLRRDLRWKLICCPFPETTFFRSSLTSADPTTRNTQPQSPPQHTKTHGRILDTHAHTMCWPSNTMTCLIKTASTL